MRKKVESLELGPLFRPAEDLPAEVDAYLGQQPAGFPSPADDYLESRLDLNRFLIQHPSATFLVRVNGASMTAGPGRVVIAVLDGRLAVKRLVQKDSKVWLAADDGSSALVEMRAEDEFLIWGVVTNVIHPLK